MNTFDPIARLQAASPDFLRRVFVTLTALLVFKLCLHFPIAGVTAATFADLPGLSRGALERFSIMALGILPWISAATIAEIAVLTLPLRLTTGIAKGGHADPFAFWVVATAMVFAAFQAFGVAVAMEAMSTLVPEPGAAFRAGVVATLVAGTAVAILLAGIITRNGIGHGFWIVWAAFALWHTVADLQQAFTAYWAGAIHPSATLTVVGGIISAIAAVVFLVLARRNLGATTAAPLVWPIFIYAAVVPWIGVAAEVISGEIFGNRQTYQLLLPQRPIGAVLAAAIIFVVTTRYGRLHGTLALAPFEAATLTAIAAGSLSATDWTGFPMPAAGGLVVLATVATVLLLDADSRHGKSELNAEPSA